MKSGNIFLAKDIKLNTVLQADGQLVEIAAGKQYNKSGDVAAGARVAPGAIMLLTKDNVVVDITAAGATVVPELRLIYGDVNSEKEIAIPIGNADFNVNVGVPVERAGAKVVLNVLDNGSNLVNVKAGSVACIRVDDEGRTGGPRVVKDVMYTFTADTTMDASKTTALLAALTAKLPTGYSGVDGTNIYTVTAPIGKDVKFTVPRIPGYLAGSGSQVNLNIFSALTATYTPAAGANHGSQFDALFTSLRARDGKVNNPDGLYFWPNRTEFDKTCYYSTIAITYRPKKVVDNTTEPVNEKVTDFIAIPRTFSSGSLVALSNFQLATLKTFLEGCRLADMLAFKSAP